jgi:hypothetical protein
MFSTHYFSFAEFNANSMDARVLVKKPLTVDPIMGCSLDLLRQLIGTSVNGLAQSRYSRVQSLMSEFSSVSSWKRNEFLCSIEQWL